MDRYLPQERHQLILDLLQANRKVMAAELAPQLGTTEVTIRRDLRYLADQGLCKRIHGGALSLAPRSGTQEERLLTRNAEKQALAMTAIGLCKPDQVIFLDASSTHMLLASLLPVHLRLTVVTNSPAIACRLLARQHIRTILIGGELDYAIGGAVDIAATDALRQFRFDLCFIGICAWSSETGFSAIHYQDAQFKRQAAARAGAIAILCTEDKIEALAAYPFLDSSQVDYLIYPEGAGGIEHYFDSTDCNLIRCKKAS